MKTLVTLLLACCFGSAMAQSNLPACPSSVDVPWTNCYGTETYADGGKYEGEYKSSDPHGQGTFTYANGDKYVGGHAHGLRNGQGTYTFANGNKYVGEYNYNKKHGQGTFTFANGYKYVGEWKDNKYNGQGIKFLANGNVDKSGIWKENELVQSKFIDVATFTRIPNLSNSASNLAQLRQTEEQPMAQSAAESSALEQDPNEDERSRLALFEKWQSDEIKRIEALSQPYLQAQAQVQAEAKPELSDLEKALAEAEEAKRKQAELEAQLLATQKPTQPPFKIAPQGKRVALVIGNAKYRFSPLNNPVNDATDMAASLRSVGFDVIEVKDATLKQMRAATRQFADKLEVSDVGLVYYSGHGIEVKGKNYLIPVNADIRREYEVVDQAFDASNLLRMMESLQSGTKKRVNILIVDACRNNDLPKSWRSTNNGLARMDAPAGSFISFATAPGQVASDGQGRNSPYTKHLLQALKQPGMPIEQVFKQVRRKVMAETAGEQVPWENSSLVGDFYFTVAR